MGPVCRVFRQCGDFDFPNALLIRLASPLHTGIKTLHPDTRDTAVFGFYGKRLCTQFQTNYPNAHTPLLADNARSGSCLAILFQARRKRCPASGNQGICVGLAVWPTNRVSDRGAYPNHVIRTEVRCVVHDVVVAELGADKCVVPEVVAQTGSGIDQEMIRTGIARIEVNAACAVIEIIEARALPPNSTQQVKANFLTDIWLIHSIESEHDRPVRLAGILVIALAASPVHIETCTVTVMENHVATDGYIQSALLRANVVSRPSEIAASVAARRSDGSEADSNVALLGGGEAGKKNNRNSTC